MPRTPKDHSRKKKNQSSTISIKEIKFVIINFLHRKLQIVPEGILRNMSEILSAFFFFFLALHLLPTLLILSF